MNYYASTTWTHETIDSLRIELRKVKHKVDYWRDAYKNIAFGELNNDNLGIFGYQKWADIFESKGWTEDLFNLCYYKPVSFNTANKTVPWYDTNGKKHTSIVEKTPTQWVSYEYESAIYDIWMAWKQYHQLWNFRLNKLEMARFDLRRVKQTPKINIEEALFVCLGLSPAVIGDIGFIKNGWYHNFDTKLEGSIGHSKFTLEDKTCETNEVVYSDIKGNKLTLKSGIYDDNGYGVMEQALRTTEQYHLLAENQQLWCVSGRILTKPFLKWAYKNKYLRQYEIKYRDKNNSPYGEKFARVLYDQLTRDGIISGNFDELWRWNEAFGWNSLHWMADEIKDMGLTPNKIPYQFKAIKQYIDYTGRAPLNQQYEEAVTDYDKKRWVEKSELIGRCLTQVELKLQDYLPSDGQHFL
mgnify:CR=1 FL=1